MDLRATSSSLSQSPPTARTGLQASDMKRAPPCPFCQSEDTVILGHNGMHGTIDLCRCNTCREEWPEEGSGDPDRGAE